MDYSAELDRGLKSAQKTWWGFLIITFLLIPGVWYLTEDETLGLKDKPYSTAQLVILGILVAIAIWDYFLAKKIKGSLIEAKDFEVGGSDKEKFLVLIEKLNTKLGQLFGVCDSPAWMGGMAFIFTGSIPLLLAFGAYAIGLMILNYPKIEIFDDFLGEFKDKLEPEAEPEEASFETSSQTRFQTTAAYNRNVFTSFIFKLILCSLLTLVMAFLAYWTKDWATDLPFIILSLYAFFLLIFNFLIIDYFFSFQKDLKCFDITDDFIILRFSKGKEKRIPIRHYLGYYRNKNSVDSQDHIILIKKHSFDVEEKDDQIYVEEKLPKKIYIAGFENIERLNQIIKSRFKEVTRSSAAFYTQVFFPAVCFLIFMGCAYLADLIFPENPGGLMGLIIFLPYILFMAGYAFVSYAIFESFKKDEYSVIGEAKEEHKDAARKILDLIRNGLDGPHEYREVNKADFSHLDLKFYQKVSDELQGRGFRFVCDIENLNLTKLKAGPKTFIRVLTNIEKGVTAGIYHAKTDIIGTISGYLSGQTPFKVHEFETVFSNGIIFTTTNASEMSSQGFFPEINFLHLKEKKLNEVYDAHLKRIDQYQEENPGIVTLKMEDFNQVVEFQNKQLEIKRSYLESVGWITKEYLYNQCGGKEKLVDILYGEIQAILKREGELNPDPNG